MSKITLTPPPLPPIPNNEDIDWEKLKQNPANKKYEKHLAEQLQRKADKELETKKKQRSDWWKASIIGIIGIIVAIAAIVLDSK